MKPELIFRNPDPPRRIPYIAPLWRIDRRDGTTKLIAAHQIRRPGVLNCDANHKCSGNAVNMRPRTMPLNVKQITDFAVSIVL